MAQSSGSEMTVESWKLTERLTSFTVETRASDVPPSAINSAKQLILDTIGVALAASTRRIGKIITLQAAEENAASCAASVIGNSGLRVSASLAALANGTMCNALDFDGGGHLPTHILPCVLALAERDGLAGSDVLTAFIIAYEAAARLTKVIDAKRAVRQGPTYRGFWHVGYIGPVAASIAASRLLRLGKPETANAIAIATASSAGFRRNMGKMAKALHSGLSARAGIEAALLAQRGFTGDPEILEAPLGFVAALTFPDERDATPITEKLGRPYVLEKSAGAKAYPAVTPSHGYIDAALALRRDHVFAIEDIEVIEADYSTFSLLRPEPTDEEAAGFCAPYLIAASLVHGALGLDQMTEEALRDQRVQALMRRVKQVPKNTRGGSHITLRFKDKSELGAEAHGQRVFSQTFIERKFRDCASSALRSSAVEEIQELVSRLETQPLVDRLMALVGGRS